MRSNSFLIGGLIGAGVGYVSALLLARQEGEQTQKELKHHTQKASYQALNKLEIQLDKLQEKLSENEGRERGKPSRINVDVKEKYDGRGQKSDVQLDIDVHSAEEDRI